MNDFQEIEYGLGCLIKAHGSLNARLAKFWKVAFDANIDEVEKAFNENIHRIRLETYLSCFSLHCADCDLDKTNYGKLSMWRAYGGKSGVAIIIRNETFTQDDSELNVHTTPVRYWTESDVLKDYERLIIQLEQNTDRVKNTGVEAFNILMVRYLESIVLATKHPGFSEEQEWRMIYHPERDSKKQLVRSVQTVNGIPQVIYKLDVSKPFVGSAGSFTFDQIVSQVIVGPTQYPFPVASALQDAMSGAGISESHKRIRISKIPLRQS